MDRAPTDLTDAHLFEELYERFFPRLVRYCRGLGLDGLAEDVAQEALVRGFVHRHRLERSLPTWAWLKTVAINLTISEMRRRSRQVPLDDDMPAEPNGLGAVEHRSVLTEPLRALSPHQRRAVILRYLHDVEPAEIGRALDISPAAVKQVLYRARIRLRLELERIGEGAWGAVLAPARAAREFAERARVRAQQATSRVSPMVEPVAGSAQPVTALVLGLALVAGGGVAPARGEPARDPGPPRELAVGAAELASSSREAPVRSDGRPAAGAHGRSAGSDEASPEENTTSLPKRAREIGDHVIDPNRDRHQPEDSRVSSIAVSGDGDILVVGRWSCARGVCPPILFRSEDDGASWKRLPAEGLEGYELILPPDPADGRIFAMSVTGLQVSEDGGDSFGHVGHGTAAHAKGSTAIAPSFNDGDPWILIGDNTLKRYRDDLQTVEPLPWPAGLGPFEPAFSPAYRTDRTIFVGGMIADPIFGYRSAVYRCVQGACSRTEISDHEVFPKLVIPEDFPETRRLYAYTAAGPFVSTDGGDTFHELPWPGPPVLVDMVEADGVLFAAVGWDFNGDRAGVYRSTDGGLTWTHLRSPLVDEGVMSLKSHGRRLIAARQEQGVACSVDAGQTWAPRCPG